MNKNQVYIPIKDHTLDTHNKLLREGAKIIGKTECYVYLKKAGQKQQEVSTDDEVICLGSKKVPQNKSLFQSKRRKVLRKGGPQKRVKTQEVANTFETDYLQKGLHSVLSQTERNLLQTTKSSAFTQDAMSIQWQTEYVRDQHKKQEVRKQKERELRIQELREKFDDMDDQMKERYFQAITIELERARKGAADRETSFKDVAQLYEKVGYDWNELERVLNFDKI